MFWAISKNNGRENGRMYRGIGKAGGIGGGLAMTGAPNVAVFLAVGLGLVVVGVCFVRSELVLRKSSR